ncbi:MAG: DUF1634 domain-containing protein [Planctomycetota bacterium]
MAEHEAPEPQPEEPPPPAAPEPGPTEVAAGGPADRWVTRGLSGLALALMFAGMAVALARGGEAAREGVGCAPLRALAHGDAGADLSLTSLGVLLLALTPVARVAVVLVGELRLRQTFSALAAGLVLLELLLGLAGAI